MSERAELERQLQALVVEWKADVVKYGCTIHLGVDKLEALLSQAQPDPHVVTEHNLRYLCSCGFSTDITAEIDLHLKYYGEAEPALEKKWEYHQKICAYCADGVANCNEGHRLSHPPGEAQPDPRTANIPDVRKIWEECQGEAQPAMICSQCEKESSSLQGGRCASCRIGEAQPVADAPSYTRTLQEVLMLHRKSYESMLGTYQRVGKPEEVSYAEGQIAGIERALEVAHYWFVLRAGASQPPADLVRACEEVMVKIGACYDNGSIDPDDLKILVDFVAKAQPPAVTPDPEWWGRPCEDCKEEKINCQCLLKMTAKVASMATAEYLRRTEIAAIEKRAQPSAPKEMK